MEIKFPQVTVQLTGKDGNAFYIIGAISAALRNEVGKEEADEYTREATSQPSYDALLQHAVNTVHVI